MLLVFFLEKVRSAMFQIGMTRAAKINSMLQIDSNSREVFLAFSE